MSSSSSRGRSRRQQQQQQEGLAEEAELLRRSRFKRSCEIICMLLG
jgi:hypothetical protein